MSAREEFALRPYDDAYRDALIALIDRVYREYGDRICLDRVDADLLDIRGCYGAARFQILTRGEQVFGSVAVKASADDPETLELKRLYLDRELRGGTWGARLLGWAEEAARAVGARRLELWSDARFDRAHRFYEKHGYAHDGRIRELDDAWEPYRELYFARPLQALP